MTQPKPFTAHSWEQIAERYADQLIAGALNVLAAAAILIIGLWIAGFAARSVRRAAKRNPRIDYTLASVLASIVRYAIIAIVLLAVLHRFGVETTSIVALFGAAALAVGLALQGTLSNLAAGVMIVVFRPYSIGDFVEVSGQQGNVRHINLFTTELATISNLKVVLPNGLCWGAPIINFTAHPTRRTELQFGVDYKSDLNQAIAVITQVLERDSRVHKTPPPFVKVRTLGDFSVTIVARYWTDTPVALDAQFDLTQKVKEALDAAGIAIPFPTTMNYEVRLDDEDETPARLEDRN
ncbi:MAG: mechanosensitive ion channel family protein [Hyphomonadaceae bacterium]